MLGMNARQTCNRQHRFFFTLRVEMDGALHVLKNENNKHLLHWLNKASVWIKEKQILAEEYIQICWLHHSHISLTCHDDATEELKARCCTDLPIQLVPRTCGTTVKSTKLLACSYVIETTHKHAAEW